MIETLSNDIGLWLQSADDDDVCLYVNIGLWPQDGPGEPRRAQESSGKPREPRSAREGRGKPRRAQENPGMQLLLDRGSENKNHRNQG